MEYSDSNDSRADVSVSGVVDSDLSSDESQSGRTRFGPDSDTSLTPPHSRIGPPLPADDTSALYRRYQGLPPASSTTTSSVLQVPSIFRSEAQRPEHTVQHSAVIEDENKVPENDTDDDGEFDGVPADLRFLLKPDHHFAFDFVKSFLYYARGFHEQTFDTSPQMSHVLMDSMYWESVMSLQVKRLVLVEGDWPMKLLEHVGEQLNDLPNNLGGGHDPAGRCFDAYRHIWALQLKLFRRWAQDGHSLSVEEKMCQQVVLLRAIQVPTRWRSDFKYLWIVGTVQRNAREDAISIGIKLRHGESIMK